MTFRSNAFCLPSLAALFMSAALCAPSAIAQGHNNPPPANPILDLAGQSVNHGTAVTESASFTAALNSTDITFAFREDPAFISFSDVTLTNTTTHSSINLIQNGTFSSGSGENPTDWTFANIYGAEASGQVAANCGGGLTTCWYDGSVQAYDAIDQYVSTIVGDNYLLSFAYSDNGPLTTFSDLSTNGDVSNTGGNGIDILAYAQAGLPPAGGTSVTPEPDSIWLMSTGTLLLCGAFYYKRRNSLDQTNF